MASLSALSPVFRSTRGSMRGIWRRAGCHLDWAPPQPSDDTSDTPVQCPESIPASM